MTVWKNKRAKDPIRFVALLLFLFMFFRWYEHNQIYHPQSQHDAKPEELGRPFEEVFLGDKPKIHGWFFPAPSNSPRRHLAVLFCHGNGGNISHCLGLIEVLLQTGVNVFLFDYRGYGQSTGKADEEGTYRDAQSAYNFLKQKGFAEKNIIAYGESLGGAIATELALREPIRALILQSTFTCIPDIGSELIRWLPVRWVCSIHYDTCRKLPQLNIPILVMHSRGDTLIGFHHAGKNFAIANEPKLFWEITGDHNDAVTDRERFIEGIETFLTLVEKGQPSK